ncbi:class I adenylate-forming enzyme family protein [Methanimicrococcus blatticola]|uniref:Long-chain acyl-CoA synthetase n=1 Tax=Methanimicrococcus blatticola TaxID=91560 RepID=A0A484F2W6_9EURY|nr:AMP-binding protein [Methanimicrococcus blatticola]MBZ3935376.1 AMP-binding protein [Methanimicrococcus blatticola]MCC2508526.1 AMP-binding protein [Methanimicrococcus blatticola]TDQ67834.1 long-chain acyl-CoA synthetase [Methanimicrococcus blatticola]
MLNITTFLDANMRRLSKNVFHCPERETYYTSAEILSIASGLAGKLKEKGIGKGDRVLIYLNNSPEYLFSYFAIWRIGAVAVPTNRVYTKFELDYMIQNAGIRLVITDEDGVDSFEESSDFSIFIPTGIEEMRNYPILPPTQTEPEDLCQIQYTSGTTGKPKGAMLTHGNWLAAISNETDVMEFVESDVYLGIYPMGHVGLSWGIAALQSGALYIMVERYELENYLHLIEKHGVTALSGMPPVIHSFVNCPAGTEERVKTVREIISGGGPLHNEIWKTFHHRYNIPIVNAYGLSETIVIGTGTVIRPVDYATADKFQSVGHPVCFSEVKIVDENDANRELAQGEIGEIALRGPAVAKGYYGMPEETKQVFLADGWFLTGDIGYLDQDLRLCLTDRKKDMIVMSGWKIYPTEVEDVFLKSGLV